MAEQITLQLAAVLCAGMASQWIAWRMRLPAIVLLLLVGVVMGPLVGFLKPDEIFGVSLLPIVSLSVALILFEGGMTLQFREVFRRRKRPEADDDESDEDSKGHGAAGLGVLGLVVVGATVTFALAAVAAHYLLGFEMKLAMLLGAVLTVTGPTVIGPLLRTVRPTGKAGTILKWEGIVIDPIGAILAVVLFEYFFGEPAAEPVRAMTLAFVNTFAAGTAIGLVAAGMVVLMVRRFWVPDFLINPFALALVIASFAMANMVQEEAGLVAVTVMGMGLANQRWVKIHRILEFKENLRVLLISGLFVLLAARLEMSVLQGLRWQDGVFVLGLILVVRPLAVFLAMPLSRLSFKEKLFVASVAPRGIVAAAVSSVFALRLQEVGYAGADRLVSTTFLVIIGTVVVYGFLALPVARKLGIAQSEPKGCLIAGANPVGRALAVSLQELGYPPILLDTNPDFVLEARRQGLDAHEVDWLREEDREGVDLGGVGRAVIMTPNDHANRLLASEALDVFGRANVFQLAAKPRPNSDGRRVEPAGRVLFGKDQTYAEMRDAIRKGCVIRTMSYETEERADQAKEAGLQDAIVLATIHESGRLEFADTGSRSAPRKGITHLLLAPPESSEPLATLEADS